MKNTQETRRRMYEDADARQEKIYADPSLTPDQKLKKAEELRDQFVARLHNALN